MAALADGEGCFSIERRNRKSRSRGIFNRPISPSFKCGFVVQMRADDEPFLRRMAAETGLGSIYVYDAAPTPGRANKPKARWSVHSVHDCRALVAILDEYPLWSKKANEYPIWREAVLAWAAQYEPHGHSQTQSEWQRLFDEIRAVRRYDPRGTMGVSWI